MRPLLLLGLFALSVLAQGKNKPKFDLPEPKEPASKPREREQERALERSLSRLAGWPSERARRAAEQLIVQRERSLSMVLSVLLSEDRRDAALKPGAAYVLGRIGGRTHSLTLLLIAAEKKQHRHASVFLEAAYRLDAEKAVAEAFRFFRLSETTLRREATKFVRDRITKKNLPAVLGLLDKRTADRPFTREIGLILLDRLVETRQVEWKDAGARFYATLGDESPQVASRAMRILAGKNNPENIGALNELITKKFSYWRQRSYAALSMAIMSSAFKVQPLTPDAIKELKGRHGLLHPKEMLVRAAAALALGEAALRTGDRELVRLLDNIVPVVLIESVGAGSRHYRDFASVMPLSYTMLRKITGQVFPDHAPRWAQWWRDNGRRFRARRELRDVEQRDLGDTAVELAMPKAAGGARVRLSVVGRTRPTYLHGRSYALPVEDMGGFVDLLREAGFFAAKEVDRPEVADDAAVVVVRVGDLVRTIHYPQTAEGTRDRILAHAKGLAQGYSWQLWWDRKKQPSWALFFGDNRKWFAENTGSGARAGRLRGMIADSLDDLLLKEDRIRAARAAAALPGGGKALSKEQVDLFVAAARSEREANEFVLEVLDLLVPAAGAKAAHGLIDVLASQPGPRPLALLAQLCMRLPDPVVATLSRDERWKVRRASVDAIALRDTSEALKVLGERLEDAEEQVRAAAAVSLARRKDQRALAALASLTTSASGESRATAALGYGLLGGETALGAIRLLLYSDTDLRVRTQAIAGLVEGKPDGADSLLLGVFERETDSRVRAAASYGLVDLEPPLLVRKLMARIQHTPSASPERVAIVNVLARFRSDEPVGILQTVLQGDDLLSADAAALGLARRWNDSAIGQLIRMAEGGRNERAAVRHLQMLSSWGNDAETFKEQSDNYKGWYKVNSTGKPLTWFRDALQIQGYDTSILNEMIKMATGTRVPPVSDHVVPLLLRILRDQQWFLRRNASFLLSHRIGPGAPPVISYDTSTQKAEQAIEAYNDWWARRQAQTAKERRG